MIVIGYSSFCRSMDIVFMIASKAETSLSKVHYRYR